MTAEQLYNLSEPIKRFIHKLWDKFRIIPPYSEIIVEIKERNDKKFDVYFYAYDSYANNLQEDYKPIWLSNYRGALEAEDYGNFNYTLKEEKIGYFIDQDNKSSRNVYNIKFHYILTEEELETYCGFARLQEGEL